MGRLPDSVYTQNANNLNPVTQSLPLIDVSPLINGGSGVSARAREIDRACRESG